MDFVVLCVTEKTPNEKKNQNRLLHECTTVSDLQSWEKTEHSGLWAEEFSPAAGGRARGNPPGRLHMASVGEPAMTSPVSSPPQSPVYWALHKNPSVRFITRHDMTSQSATAMCSMMTELWQTKRCALLRLKLDGQVFDLWKCFQSCSAALYMCTVTTCEGCLVDTTSMHNSSFGLVRRDWQMKWDQKLDS